MPPHVAADEPLLSGPDAWVTTRAEPQSPYADDGQEAIALPPYSGFDSTEGLPPDESPFAALGTPTAEPAPAPDAIAMPPSSHDGREPWSPEAAQPAAAVAEAAADAIEVPSDFEPEDLEEATAIFLGSAVGDAMRWAQPRPAEPQSDLAEPAQGLETEDAETALLEKPLQPSRLFVDQDQPFGDQDQPFGELMVEPFDDLPLAWAPAAELPYQATRLQDQPAELMPTVVGDLNETPLVHLLVYALDQALSGTAVLEPPDQGAFMIYFHEGVPSKVRTPPDIHALDQTLVEMDLLDEATLEQTRRAAAERRMLHGEYLVSAGLLDEATLHAALSWQLARKLTHMLQLPSETRYSYYDGLNLLEDYGGPELTPSEPLALIMSGVRLRSRDPIVDETLSRLKNVPLALHPNADTSRLTLREPEKRVVELLRTRSLTLSQVAAFGVAPERVVQLTVYALVITRCLVLGGSARPPVGMDYEPPNPPPRPAEVPAQPAPPPPAAPPSWRRAPPEPLPRRGSRTGGQRPEPPRRGTQSGRRAQPLPRRGARTGETPRAPRRVAKVAIARVARAEPPPLRARLTREEIAERARTIDDQTHFEVLGVERDAPHEAVHQAYLGLLKKWHPDRLPAGIEDMRDTAARIYLRINEAYQTLNDPQRRSEYAQVVAAGAGSAPQQAMAARAADATLLFQKAEVLFKKGAVAEAERMLQEAVQADPKRPDCRALLAWVRANQLGPPPPLPPGQTSPFYQAQLEALDEVVDDDPDNERARYYRAELLKRSGYHEKALRDYRRATELNPRNINAAREVRLADMRTGRETGPGSGLFGKLFGAGGSDED